MANAVAQGSWRGLRIRNTFLTIEDEEVTERHAEARKRRTHSCPACPVKPEHFEEEQLNVNDQPTPKWNDSWYASSDVLLIENQEEYSGDADSQASTQPSYGNSGKNRSGGFGQQGNYMVSFNQQKAQQFSGPPSEELWRAADYYRPASDGDTTMMIRNIPCRCTKEDILWDINALGFEGQYDYFYLPQGRRRQCNLGYAFINFKMPAFATNFQIRMHGQRLATKRRCSNSQKVCEVTSAAIQGLEKNLERFQKTAMKRMSDTAVHISPEPTPGAFWSLEAEL